MLYYVILLLFDKCISMLYNNYAYNLSLNNMFTLKQLNKIIKL